MFHRSVYEERERKLKHVSYEPYLKPTKVEGKSKALERYNFFVRR